MDAPVFNPATNALEMPSSETVTDATQSTTSGGTSKALSKAGRKALADWLAAEQEKQEAQTGGALNVAPPQPPTAEDVAADLVNQQAGVQPKSDQTRPRPTGDLDRLMTSAEQPDDLAARGAPRYTSAQLGATPQMQPPQTFEATKDEAAADSAREKATADKAYAKQLQDIQAAEAKAQTDALNRINQLAAGKEANTKITSLFEDMSAPRRILAKIGVALGGWVSAYTGGPNNAQQALEHEMDLDFKAKQFKAEQYMHEMQAAGALPAQIRQWGTDAQTHALASQKAQLDLIESHANTMLAPWPQAQRQLRQTIAEEKAKNAQTIANFVATNTGVTGESHTTNESPRHTTVTALKGQEGKTPGQAVVAQKALKDAEENLKFLKQMDDDTFRELTTEASRGKEHAEKLKHDLGGTEWERMSAKAKQDYLGAPASGIQAAGEVAGQEGESFVSRDNSVTGAVTAMTNPRAAANPEMLEKLGETRGAAAPGISRAEAIRRAETQIEVLKAESARNSPLLNRIDATEKRGAGASPAATPLTGSAIASAPAIDRARYVAAKRAAKPSPGQERYIKNFEARYGK